MSCGTSWQRAADPLVMRCCCEAERVWASWRLPDFSPNQCCVNAPRRGDRHAESAQAVTGMSRGVTRISGWSNPNSSQLDLQLSQATVAGAGRTRRTGGAILPRRILEPIQAGGNPNENPAVTSRLSRYAIWPILSTYPATGMDTRLS